MRAASLALVSLSAAFASCAPAPLREVAPILAGVSPAALPIPSPPAGTRPSVPRDGGTVVRSVVVVTIDGARWQEIFRGADPAFANDEDLEDGAPERVTPTLHRWMSSEGVGFGAPGHGEVRASGPKFVSLPGYTEIFTGRPSRCHSNGCGPIQVPTLVDELLDEGKDALIVSSWERIARAAAEDPSRVELSSGRDVLGASDAFDADALAAGRASGPWPGSDDYRPDALTMRVALSALDRGVPSFTFVGLGDTDEHAHHGDYHAYLGALRAADDFLARLEDRLDGHTAVFVTADHGRCPTFRDHGMCDSSARVFLAVRAPWLHERGYVDSREIRLADLAPTIRCMLGVPADPAPDAGRPIDALCPSR
jgi:hypothetical protein